MDKAKKVQIPTRLDTKDAIASLDSEICPACARVKRRGQTLCRRDYRCLPVVVKADLYNPVGHGYEDAVVAALSHLGGDGMYLSEGV